MNPVEWWGKARDQLADIWVQATPDERDRIEREIPAVERDLADAPEVIGESRGGRLRVVIRDELTYWFAVEPGGRVRIVRVHRPPQRA